MEGIIALSVPPSPIDNDAGQERAFGKVGLKKRKKIKRQGHRSIKTKPTAPRSC
jgi:hypothetical protein